jgi:hypothetical protein
LDYWNNCNGASSSKPAYCTDGSLKLDQFLKCPAKVSLLPLFDVDSVSLDPVSLFTLFRIQAPFAKTYNTTFNQVSTLITDYMGSYASNTVDYTQPSATLNPLTDYASFKENTLWRKNQYTATASVVTACSPGSSTNGVGYLSTCLDGDATQNKCPANSPVIPPSVSTAPCSQKGVLTAADLMWGSSYIASCRYLTGTAKVAVADGKACNRIGSGFFYLFAAHGAIATLYMVIVLITLHGYKAWSNPEEDVVGGGDQFYDEDEEGTNFGLQPPGTASDPAPGGVHVGSKEKDFV